MSSSKEPNFDGGASALIALVVGLIGLIALTSGKLFDAVMLFIIAGVFFSFANKDQ